MFNLTLAEQRLPAQRNPNRTHRKPYLLGHAAGSLMRICQQQHQVIFVDNKVKIKKLKSNLSHVAKRKKPILKLDSFVVVVVVVVVAVIDVTVVVDIVIVACCLRHCSLSCCSLCRSCHFC